MADDATYMLSAGYIAERGDAAIKDQRAHFDRYPEERREKNIAEAMELTKWTWSWSWPFLTKRPYTREEAEKYVDWWHDERAVRLAMGMLDASHRDLRHVVDKAKRLPPDTVVAVPAAMASWIIGAEDQP